MQNYSTPEREFKFWVFCTIYTIHFIVDMKILEAVKFHVTRDRLF